jgi:hypothetical protein
MTLTPLNFLIILYLDSQEQSRLAKIDSRELITNAFPTYLIVFTEILFLIFRFQYPAPGITVK